jgi:hypothetical protein
VPKYEQIAGQSCVKGSSTAITYIYYSESN